ncbi:hypothetical protein B296_00009361 [Ensete ventricosum]|uniref:Uncharacterized protein n=1 Tax=Ensete ventricosum TaxID=4639 RepID=A0A426ZD51_ENSVE|nr:hypothetical protein B296_00009361 [Ensete ventricosum]
MPPPPPTHPTPKPLSWRWRCPQGTFRTYSLLWNPGHPVELVKTDWSQAAVTAALWNCSADRCVWSSGVSSCSSGGSKAWMWLQFAAPSLNRRR